MQFKPYYILRTPTVLCLIAMLTGAFSGSASSVQANETASLHAATAPEADSAHAAATSEADSEGSVVLSDDSQDLVVSDLFAVPSMENDVSAQTDRSSPPGNEKDADAKPGTGNDPNTETEAETGSFSALEKLLDAEPEFGINELMETETVYEIPQGLTEDLEKNTPSGEAAQLTAGEREEIIDELWSANAPEKLWERHENISTSCQMYDEDAQMWKEYSCSYADPLVYYSDDWSPGLEELRLLIYNGDSCVEDYTKTMRFVCFLNATGSPYRDPESAPVTISNDTKNESLLKLHRTHQALYLITRLTESTIHRLNLEEPQENAFYSCLYVVDPATKDVQLLQISLHENSPREDSLYEDSLREDSLHTVKEMIRVSYSYDTGMSAFVQTGYDGLLRHLLPGAAWAPENLRTVTLTLDPGTRKEKVFSVSTLKGDPVSLSLPEGYIPYQDETLSKRWVDNGDYASDLNLWAALPEHSGS